MVALVGQAGRVACLSVCWTWVGHTQSPVDVVCQAISCQIWCQTCNIQHPEVEVRHNAAARPAERAAPAKRLCRCARVKGGNKLECRAGVSVGAPARNASWTSVVTAGPASHTSGDAARVPEKHTHVCRISPWGWCAADHATDEHGRLEHAPAHPHESEPRQTHTRFLVRHTSS